MRRPRFLLACILRFSEAVLPSQPVTLVRSEQSLSREEILRDLESDVDNQLAQQDWSLEPVDDTLGAQGAKGSVSITPKKGLQVSASKDHKSHRVEVNVDAAGPASSAQVDEVLEEKDDDKAETSEERKGGERLTSKASLHEKAKDDNSQEEEQPEQPEVGGEAVPAEVSTDAVATAPVGEDESGSGSATAASAPSPDAEATAASAPSPDAEVTAATTAPTVVTMTASSSSDDDSDSGGAVVVVIVLICLAAGGGGGWYYMQQKKKGAAQAAQGKPLVLCQRGELRRG